MEAATSWPGSKGKKEEDARVPISPRRAHPGWCSFLQVGPVSQEFQYLVRCGRVCLRSSRAEGLPDLRPYHSLSSVMGDDVGLCQLLFISWGYFHSSQRSAGLSRPSSFWGSLHYLLTLRD